MENWFRRPKKIDHETIEKITISLNDFEKKRDALIKKYAPREYIPCPEGKAALKKVEDMARKITEQYGGTFETTFYPEELNVTVEIEVPFLSVTMDMLCSIVDFKDYITVIMILSGQQGFVIEIDINYYEGDVSPVELAMQELLDE